ncbi:hypothetical protein [Allorhizobium terrae]|uniref:hypothetical protein n=1 Tax=Allorhizobium terrae TaxID=1848972 RepID=UPI0011ACC780|nr:hypothetical protein [Allorhizobium terrae]TWD46970.1 hypothetical protein FB480_11139 [Agrobacterium vitis]
MTRDKRSIHSNFETLRSAIRSAASQHSYFRFGYGAFEQMATRPWQQHETRARC